MGIFFTNTDRTVGGAVVGIKPGTKKISKDSNGKTSTAGLSRTINDSFAGFATNLTQLTNTTKVETFTTTKSFFYGTKSVEQTIESTNSFTSDIEIPKFEVKFQQGFIPEGARPDIMLFTYRSPLIRFLSESFNSFGEASEDLAGAKVTVGDRNFVMESNLLINSDKKIFSIDFVSQNTTSSSTSGSGRSVTSDNNGYTGFSSTTTYFSETGIIPDRGVTVNNIDTILFTELDVDYKDTFVSGNDEKAVYIDTLNKKLYNCIYLDFGVDSTMFGSDTSDVYTGDLSRVRENTFLPVLYPLKVNRNGVDLSFAKDINGAVSWSFGTKTGIVNWKFDGLGASSETTRVRNTKGWPNGFFKTKYINSEKTFDYSYDVPFAYTDLSNTDTSILKFVTIDTNNNTGFSDIMLSDAFTTEDHGFRRLITGKIDSSIYGSSFSELSIYEKFYSQNDGATKRQALMVDYKDFTKNFSFEQFNV